MTTTIQLTGTAWTTGPDAPPARGEATLHSPEQTATLRTQWQALVAAARAELAPSARKRRSRKWRRDIRPTRGRELHELLSRGPSKTRTTCWEVRYLIGLGDFVHQPMYDTLPLRRRRRRG